MATTSTYLNFSRNTEDAFNFYKSIFGGEFIGGINRMADIPMPDGAPPLSETDKNLVMHVALPILGGHILMGADAPESMGFSVKFGNNIYISLDPDTKDETDKLFDALSAGGKVEQPLMDMFWGAYTNLVPTKVIKYTMPDERKVEIYFEQSEQGIKITETFEAETENPIEMQKAGWQAILNSFKKYTESN